MSPVRAVRKLAALDGRTLLLLAESFFYLAWARLLVAKNFSGVAPSLGEPMSETPHAAAEADPALLRSISTALHMAARRTPWDSKCLVRAIAALKMLSRRGISCTLYLGTARDADGSLAAHAWLRSGVYYVTGAEEMRKFTVVGTFAKGSIRARNEGVPHES